MEPLVLIVDDNEKNLKLARDVLRAAGLRTLEAETGAEGIALAAEHLPDVILMDLRLPDMDGADAARALADDVRTAHHPRRRAERAATRGRRRMAPRRRLRRLPREADRHPSVSGACAQLLPPLSGRTVLVTRRIGMLAPLDAALL